MAAFMNSLCLLLSLTVSLVVTERALNEFIKDYQQLDYRPKPRRFAKKRSTRRDSHPLYLVITAFGRNISLYLRRDLVTFASDIEMLDAYGMKINLGQDSFVVGTVRGEPGANAYGVLHKSGIFTGKIETRNETYFVERTETYFGNASTFHSVIYRLKDVLYNVNDSRSKGVTHYINLGHEKGFKSVRTNFRLRRSTSDYERNICRLSLESDHTFLKMAGGLVYAVQTMVTHIQALNDIVYKAFSTTDTIAPYGIRFQIAKIKIYSHEEETARVLARGNFDAATFLSLMSTKGNYSGYCEALFFTARSFADGVLGLASPLGACSASNTAFVTFTRENMRLPTTVTEMAVAREIGYAFGVKDDPDVRNECNSNQKNGDSIKEATVGTDGHHPNTVAFSPCDVNQMRDFIDSIRTNKKHCLKSLDRLQNAEALCGNGVVDAGEHIEPSHREECDCGDEDSCRDLEPGNCCNSKTCRLNKHALCSVSNGLCCNPRTCQFRARGEVCMPETECSFNATCHGNTSTCPPPPHKNDLDECNGNASVCMNGTCRVSVCVNFRLKSCFCDKKEDQCKICCRYKGDCLTAEDIPEMKSRIKSAYLSPGSFCLHNRGYCNVFHECHYMDRKGALARLHEVYVTEKGIKRITHEYWWAIFLGTVGLIGCIYLVIKHCALYTVSSNPVLNNTEPARTLPWIKIRRSKDDEEREMITDDDISSGT